MPTRQEVDTLRNTLLANATNITPDELRQYMEAELAYVEERIAGIFPTPPTTNAADLTSGTLNDARLSANVVKLTGGLLPANLVDAAPVQNSGKPINSAWAFNIFATVSNMGASVAANQVSINALNAQVADLQAEITDLKAQNLSLRNIALVDESAVL